jgi:hypothetical protein
MLLNVKWEKAMIGLIRRHRPVCWAIIWIAVVYICIGVIFFEEIWASFPVILPLLFLLTVPLPFFLFPSIVISVRVKNDSSYKGNEEKSINKCKDKDGLCLMVDGREINIGDLPAQVKVYCARKSNHKVYLCHDNILYHEEADLYEEHTCSVEIVAEEKT